MNNASLSHPDVVADQEASAHLDLSGSGIQDPPASLGQALRQIGPGLVLAASIVGTGELIATTSLGAKAGFVLLWLVILSCIIKVFTQVELGRLAITRGQTTLQMLDTVPGPRIGASWMCWVWLLMTLATQAQIATMEGLIGQAATMAFPGTSAAMTKATGIRSDVLWAGLTALAAIALLISGGYTRLERITTIMVALVTGFTVTWAVGLQFTDYAVSPSDVASGFTFAFPAGTAALALTAFGITGVGASELFAYPYWCLEKGYGRAVGPRDATESWASRARGWVRVMKLDAWFSMGVFTIATLAFYFLGAAVLNQDDAKLKGAAMIERLSRMYADPLRNTAMASLVPATVVGFLIGAWAVLFKTLYVATAGNAHITADLLGIAGAYRADDPRKRARVADLFHIAYPVLAFILYVAWPDPLLLVQTGGLAQAVTLPLIAGSALYLRYRDHDPRVGPSRLSDAGAWLAFVAVTSVPILGLVLNL